MDRLLRWNWMRGFVGNQIEDRAWQTLPGTRRNSRTRRSDTFGLITQRILNLGLLALQQLNAR